MLTDEEYEALIDENVTYDFLNMGEIETLSYEQKAKYVETLKLNIHEIYNEIEYMRSIEHIE